MDNILMVLLTKGVLMLGLTHLNSGYLPEMKAAIDLLLHNSNTFNMKKLIF
jgi:hypothetical protein